jgi:hypothetical protein
MKKYFLLLSAAAMLTGCATTTKLPEPYSYSSAIDYSSLTEQGYFVTESNSVNFDYKGIGSVFATSVAGWVKKSAAKDEKSDKSFDSWLYFQSWDDSKSHYRHAEASINEAFKALGDRLKELGADGIINLKYDYTYSQSSEPKVTVSGMAIKRL